MLVLPTRDKTEKIGSLKRLQMCQNIFYRCVNRITNVKMENYTFLFGRSAWQRGYVTPAMRDSMVSLVYFWHRLEESASSYSESGVSVNQLEASGGLQRTDRNEKHGSQDHQEDKKWVLMSIQSKFSIGDIFC